MKGGEVNRQLPDKGETVSGLIYADSVIINNEGGVDATS